MNLYPLGKTVSYWLVRVLFRMRYEGLENIPKGRGFILASNHRSNFDPLFIAHKIPQQIHYMAKAELFKNPLLGWAMRRIGSFPVQRGKGDTSALERAGQIMEQGGILGMFPEGHRSKDGAVQRPRSGIAIIAGQTGAAVLPCAVIYGKRLGFRTVVTVRYGELICSEQLAADASPPSSIRSCTKQIMGDIVALLPPAGGAE